jgi:hypothetical protein
MKRKVKIWFPVRETFQDEIEVDIPNTEDDHDEWLSENKERLVQEHLVSEDGYSDDPNAFEFDYAGAKFIDDPPQGEE